MTVKHRIQSSIGDTRFRYPGSRCRGGGFRSNPGGWSGFTLVEILVVVVILAILMSLLVPSVSKLVAKGQDAGCIQNLKKIHVGLMAYVADHNGAFFDESDTHDFELAPYFGLTGTYPYANSGSGWRDVEVGKNPFHCPRLLHHRSRYEYQRGIPMMANNNYLGNGSQGPANPELPSPAWPGGPLNVRQPSKMWIYTEGALERDGVIRNKNPSFMPGNFDVMRFQGLEAPAWPHGGRKNFLFLDGHVEALTWAQVDLRMPTGGGSNAEERRAFWGIVGE